MSVRGTHVPEHLRLPIAGVTPPPTEKDGQRLFPTGNFRFYRPVYRDKTPPCNHACPTGEQIQKYLDHVKHDRYLDGYLTILEDNPMPSVTGRVCYHPCETACNRAAHDEPIGIRGVERFLGDFGLKLADNPIKKDLPPLNGKTVAIVGSGPGGLGCAYHLRRQGYASVIFEALDKPGGMLRAGIPAWHLPEEILDAEIAKLLDLGGIEIRCGVRVGSDGPDPGRTRPPLRRGLPRPRPGCRPAPGRRGRAGPGRDRRPRVPARDRPGPPGQDGQERARHRRRQHGLRRGPVGDQARAAEAAEATIVSLEAEDELLIVAEDLAQARDEGVRFRPQTALVRVLADDEGNVRGAVLGEASCSGTPRRGHAPAQAGHRGRGALRHHPGRHRPGAGPRLAARRLHRTRPGQSRRVRPHPHPSGTVFTGGDVMRGPSMVVDALGDGKRAARDIDRVLSAEPLRPDNPVEVMPYEKLNTAYFRHAPRTEAPVGPRRRAGPARSPRSPWPTAATRRWPRRIAACPAASATAATTATSCAPTSA